MCKIIDQIKFLLSHPEKLEEFKANARAAALQFTPGKAFEYVREVVG